MILEQFSLAGKVAVVTGSNTGIGQGIAIGLAEAGADIVAVHRSDISATRAEIEKLGRKFLSVQCDVTDKGVPALVVEKTVKAFGRLDILVNNAGMNHREDPLEFSEEMWDKVIDVNLKSVFMLSQAAARQMVKQGSGKIINVGSLLSYQGGHRIPAYTASKFGVRGLTMSLSNEWASQNIQVNAIGPGYIQTNMTKALQADEERNRSISERIPAGRWGTTEDLKGVVVFLASEASSYINGVTIPIDGGWLGR